MTPSWLWYGEQQVKCRGLSARLPVANPTRSRREEIGALRWKEVDGNIIRLPRERTKNDVPLTIPLSPQAAALIEELPDLPTNDLVFSTTGTTHVSNWSRAKASLDAAVTAFNGGHSIPDSPERRRGLSPRCVSF